MINRALSNNERRNVTLKMPHLYMKPTLQIAVFCILFGTLVIVEANEPKSVLSMEDVNAMIPAIEDAERYRFSNLKIDSELWVETKADLSDPCENWQRTPIYISSTIWLDGHLNGKARMDVHKEVLEWRNGAAPYGESSYSAGFDGKHGRVVEHTFGHSGKTFSLKEAELLPQAPGRLRSNLHKSWSGAKISLQFFFSDEDKDMGGRSFARLFRTAISPDALKAKAFEVALEEFQGVECIKIGLREGEKGGAYIVYWLDPARGFALLGHDNISIRKDGSEHISKRIRVTKLKEVAPGIWWPMEATLISSPLKPGDPYRRTVYRASNVVSNDPNFDESIFTVPFPNGYLIDDQVTGSKYRVGEDPNAPTKQQDK